MGETLNTNECLQQTNPFVIFIFMKSCPKLMFDKKRETKNEKLEEARFTSNISLTIFNFAEIKVHCSFNSQLIHLLSEILKLNTNQIFLLLWLGFLTIRRQ